MANPPLRTGTACHEAKPSAEVSAFVHGVIRRSGQRNTAFTDPDHLMCVLRRRLRELQYRPDLLDGGLAATGLTLTTSPPEAQ